MRLRPNRHDSVGDRAEHGAQRVPGQVGDHLALGAVQNLDQAARVALPDVEGVGARASGAHVLGVARKAAHLPRGPKIMLNMCFILKTGF